MATKPIYFWRETAGDSPWLSQWYPSPFYDDQDDTIIYKTAEQYVSEFEQYIPRDHERLMVFLPP